MNGSQAPGGRLRSCGQRYDIVVLETGNQFTLDRGGNVYNLIQERMEAIIK